MDGMVKINIDHALQVRQQNMLSSQQKVDEARFGSKLNKPKYVDNLDTSFPTSLLKTTSPEIRTF